MMAPLVKEWIPQAFTVSFKVQKHLKKLFWYTIDPWISDRGTFFKFRWGLLFEGAPNWRGQLFYFPKLWVDMIIFLNTTSACKQQHKLFVEIKKLILKLKLQYH